MLSGAQFDEIRPVYKGLLKRKVLSITQLLIYTPIYSFVVKFLCMHNKPAENVMQVVK
ncbi:protein of unknown function [Shewanella benthica]|uniref:Uncharacterized protein n=1 Tax=Shewanella benthica TaxID=43661 RepID=A0A330M6S4_9GAMM|nr:protein of unknown function [Shewanella benthica]